MKVLKTLFLVFICFLFVSSLILLQMNNAVNNTVFSDRYFDKIYDKNKDDVDFGELIKSDEKSIKMLANNIDESWLETELPNTVKGMYTYLCGRSETVPPVSIAPLKETLISTYTDEIIKNGDINKQIENIVSRIKMIPGGAVVDGKASKTAVDYMLKLEPIKEIGFSREEAENFVLKIGQNTSNKELAEIAIREMIINKSGINEMSDELDVLKLINTVYGSESNPLSATRNLVNDIHDKSVLLNVLLFILLLLIIVAVAFYPFAILKWVGASFVLSGLLFLAPVLFSYFVSGELSVINSQAAQKWLQSYEGGIVKFITVQGIIITLVGIALIVFGFYVKKAKDIKRHFHSARAIAAVILILGMVFCSFIISKSIKNDVVKYNNAITQYENNNDKMEFSQAMNEVLNTRLFTMEY